MTPRLYIAEAGQIIRRNLNGSRSVVSLDSAVALRDSHRRLAARQEGDPPHSEALADQLQSAIEAVQP